MLVASILKYASAFCRSVSDTYDTRVFYWFGAYYDKSLLIQAILMIFVQTILLKVALDNRAPMGASGGLEHVPFSGYNTEGIIEELTSGRRPYNFWRWNTAKPYVFSRTGNHPIDSATATSSFLHTLRAVSWPSMSFYHSSQALPHIFPCSATSA